MIRPNLVYLIGQDLYAGRNRDLSISLLSSRLVSYANISLLSCFRKELNRGVVRKMAKLML